MPARDYRRLAARDAKMAGTAIYLVFVADTGRLRPRHERAGSSSAAGISRTNI